MKGKKRWKLGSGIVIAILVIAAVWMLRPAPEPIYQGKPLSYWLTELHWPHGLWETDSSSSFREMTSEPSIAVRTIGTNAFPTLLHLLEARQNRWTEKVNEYLTRIPRVKFQFETSEFKRDRAYMGFLALGPLAKPAVPDLIRIYARFPRDVSQWTRVTHILGEMGSAAEIAVPYLVADLANQRADVPRGNLAYNLGKIQAPATITIPALVAALDDEDFGVRYEAISALGKFHDNTESVIPALMKALRDTNDFVPSDVARALGNIGPAALVAMPLLKRMVAASDDPSGGQFFDPQNLTIAIKKISPSNSELCDFPH